MNPLPYQKSSIRFQILTALLAMAACVIRADAAITWSSVQWFTWTPISSPLSATGTVAGQQVSVALSGTNSALPGAGSSNFDVQGNGTFSMNTPSVGLGRPKGGTTVTYTLDLSSLTIPVSSLVIGIANLDAINNRGSITVSALDSASQASNVNTWNTEAQFKDQTGTPASQALVVRSTLGNSMLLTTVQGSDNTSWGDSRGIFFTGLDDDLSSISFAHYYNHPNSTITDNIGFYIGIVPEPSPALLVAGACIAGLSRRSRRQFLQPSSVT
jgi:hypothetical protein